MLAGSRSCQRPPRHPRPPADVFAAFVCVCLTLPGGSRTTGIAVLPLRDQERRCSAFAPPVPASFLAGLAHRHDLLHRFQEVAALGCGRYLRKLGG